MRTTPPRASAHNHATLARTVAPRVRWSRAAHVAGATSDNGTVVTRSTAKGERARPASVIAQRVAAHGLYRVVSRAPATTPSANIIHPERTSPSPVAEASTEPASLNANRTDSPTIATLAPMNQPTRGKRRSRVMPARPTSNGMTAMMSAACDAEVLWLPRLKRIGNPAKLPIAERIRSLQSFHLWGG